MSVEEWAFVAPYLSFLPEDVSQRVYSLCEVFNGMRNAQDGLIWRLLSGNAHESRALDAMGFVESTGDYAVPPAFMTRLREG